MKNVFKSIIVVSAAITVVGFTSCQKDNSDQNGRAEVKEAVLSIQLTNPTMTRVAGTAPATDNTVSNFSVFVLDENNVATWKTYVDATTSVNEDDASTPFDIADIATDPYMMKVSTNASAVYVIANAGDQTANYSSLSELQAAQIDLAGQYTARWATGNSAALTFAETAGVQQADATVTLKFVAARVTVKVVNNMTNYTGTGSTVIINNVALMNVRGQSKLFGTSLIPATYTPAEAQYLQGLANPVAPDAFANYPAAFTMDLTNSVNAYAPTVNAPGDVDDATSYFFVYEAPAANDATAFPTVVTLVATDIDGTTPVYFPVHLASYETWANSTAFSTAGIVRGNSYDLTITLTGDATTSSGGGTADPTVNVVNALVNIKLEITDWNPITLEKEF